MYRAWNITRDCDDDCEQVDDFRENSQVGLAVCVCIIHMFVSLRLISLNVLLRSPFY